MYYSENYKKFLDYLKIKNQIPKKNNIDFLNQINNYVRERKINIDKKELIRQRIFNRKSSINLSDHGTTYSFKELENIITDFDLNELEQELLIKFHIPSEWIEYNIYNPQSESECFKLEPYQKAMVNDYNSLKIYQIGRGGRKTTTIQFEILFWLLYEMKINIFILYYSDKQRKLFIQEFSQILKDFQNRNKNYNLSFNFADNRYRIENTKSSLHIAITGENTTHEKKGLRGGRYSLLILDEAMSISKENFDLVMPYIIGQKNPRIILSGTIKREKLDHWYIKKIIETKENNKNNDYKDGVLYQYPSMVNPDFTEKMKKDFLNQMDKSDFDAEFLNIIDTRKNNMADQYIFDSDFLNLSIAQYNEEIKKDFIYDEIYAGVDWNGHNVGVYISFIKVKINDPNDRSKDLLVYDYFRIIKKEKLLSKEENIQSVFVDRVAKELYQELKSKNIKKCFLDDGFSQAYYLTFLNYIQDNYGIQERKYFAGICELHSMASGSNINLDKYFNDGFERFKNIKRKKCVFASIFAYVFERHNFFIRLTDYQTLQRYNISKLMNNALIKNIDTNRPSFEIVGYNSYDHEFDSLMFAVNAYFFNTHLKINTEKSNFRKLLESQYA